MIAILEYIQKRVTTDIVTRGSHKFILSPFTVEKTPSFAIYERTNSYYDWASNFGGDVIDLHRRLNKLSRKEAYIQMVKGDFKNSVLSFNPSAVNVLIKKEPTYKIISKLKIKNSALLSYAKDKRGISESVLVNNCKELKYQLKNGNTYTAISFNNNKSGVEVRSQYFKGSFGPKGITTISRGSETLDIFEGFIDYLTFLEIKKMITPVNDTIILNSVVFVKQIKPDSKIKNIRLFMDNDKAGDKATDFFKKIFTNFTVVDMRKLYKNFRDLNDYHVSKNKS